MTAACTRPRLANDTCTHRIDPGTGRWQRVNRLCLLFLALKHPFFSLRLPTFLGKKQFVLRGL